MITKITIINFKQLEKESIELGSSVVVVGPNNSGKTTLLQAISLFGLAKSKWSEERHHSGSKASRRSGVGINLEEALNIPAVSIDHFWKDKKVRTAQKNAAGKFAPKSVFIEIHAEGFTKGVSWRLGFEMEYARENLLYARLTTDPETNNLYEFQPVLDGEAIGYLPSMSGLSMVEDKLEKGSINRLIGQGNTSVVLRNIAYQLYLQSLDDKGKIKKGSEWERFVEVLHKQFRVKLRFPEYNSRTGILTLTYDEGEKTNMDLSDLGSGARQAILLFAYLFSSRNTIHLLDEPDAHLEVIKQRNLYDEISRIIKDQNAQLIVASHSESVINATAFKDRIIASLLGKLIPFNYDGNQPRKSVMAALSTVGYEDYLLANQLKRILYLEGSTDLDMLKAFAKHLDHPAYDLLQGEYIFKPVANQPIEAIKHYQVIADYVPDLQAFGLFDKLNQNMPLAPKGLELMMWQRNEMENYLVLPDCMENWLKSRHSLFEQHDFEKFNSIFASRVVPAAIQNHEDPFWIRTKVSDEILDMVLDQYFTEMGFPIGLLDKSKYYQLVAHCPKDKIQQEMIEKLDAIAAILS